MCFRARACPRSAASREGFLWPTAKQASPHNIAASRIAKFQHNISDRPRLVQRMPVGVRFKLGARPSRSERGQMATMLLSEAKPPSKTPEELRRKGGAIPHIGRQAAQREPPRRSILDWGFWILDSIRAQSLSLPVLTWGGKPQRENHPVDRFWIGDFGFQINHPVTEAVPPLLRKEGSFWKPGRYRSQF